MDPGTVWQSLEALRRAGPLVHNITNYVSMDVAANALLAIGASPAMIHAEEEVEEFVTIADALIVNIGTLSAPWVRGMEKAARAAVATGTPWVLDPVGAGATRYRSGVADDLARIGPAVLRGNASEILAMAGTGAAARGVDSVHASASAEDAARGLAERYGCVVAVTGEIDLVTDGRRLIEVRNGHPLMTRITALGCSASAIVGAFLAVQPDPVLAAAHALAVFGLAGEMAARQAGGPGSLRTALMDTLHTLDRNSLNGVRITAREGTA